MSKKELRLAVVIYGGASLAVYMHGVTKEMLKLVRASKVFHQMGIGRARYASYAEGPDNRQADTEAVYFEILKEINGRSHFRVVLDVIAGASAGAINSVMLAKAIVDDASLDSQTGTWLSVADVEDMGRETSPWQKWWLYPILRLLFFWLPRDVGASPETREKLARVVRSSWFQPPLSGARLSHIFFNSLEAMLKTRLPGSSLLPAGQRLDVYTSITDLVGYPRSIRLHDELMASEREHGAYCRFTHMETEAGRRLSDLDDANLPGLVWAARASSSYAGAFEPFHHSELKRVLAERHLSWPLEEKFLHYNVFVRDGTPAARLFDPADRYFVDGGIVNNKPFEVALEALGHRPADRLVERCIVYIEPDPSAVDVVSPERNLGYLRTIRAALSSIPRNQPIVDDLQAIVSQDKRVRINRRIVESNAAEINTLVRELQDVARRQEMTADLITYLRTAILERAEEDMSIAYHAYVQRRVWRLTDALVDEWAVLAENPNDERTRDGMSESISRSWQGAESGDAGRRDNMQETFLDRFDVTYRIRRLQFVIRRINQHEDVTELDEASTDALDSFKNDAYGFLERLHRLRRSQYLDGPLIEKLAVAARNLPLEPDEARDLLKDIFGALGLQSFDREFDALICTFLDRLTDDRLRDQMLTDYVGFPVFDVLLMSPASLEGGPDPLTPISVERISPEDAPTLRSVFKGLKSRQFMGFLGFFNRAYREHDYLWGRLNAADRLVDLLVQSSRDAISDPDRMRLKLFRAVVDRERQQLYRCDDELDRIDAFLKAAGV